MFKHLNVSINNFQNCIKKGHYIKKKYLFEYVLMIYCQMNSLNLLKKIHLMRHQIKEESSLKMAKTIGTKINKSKYRVVSIKLKNDTKPIIWSIEYYVHTLSDAR